MSRPVQLSVRDLKNQTTRILRRVEAGDRFIVTKRGRAVAPLTPWAPTQLGVPDSIYQTPRRQIEARSPGVRGRSLAAVAREFERISRKAASSIPSRDLRDLDRVVRGDVSGFRDGDLPICCRVFPAHGPALAPLPPAVPGGGPEDRPGV